MRQPVDNFQHTLQALQQGEVIAYPTEGVLGSVCDPTIIHKPSETARLKTTTDGKRVDPNSRKLRSVVALY